MNKKKVQDTEKIEKIKRTDSSFLKKSIFISKLNLTNFL